MVLLNYHLSVFYLSAEYNPPLWPWSSSYCSHVCLLSLTIQSLQLFGHQVEIQSQLIRNAIIIYDILVSIHALEICLFGFHSVVYVLLHCSLLSLVIGFGYLGSPVHILNLLQWRAKPRLGPSVSSTHSLSKGRWL